MAWSEVATAVLATSASPSTGVTTYNLGSLAGGTVASGDKVTGKVIISDQNARTISSVTDDSGNSWAQDLSNSTVDGTYTNHYDVWSTVLSSATLPANITLHFSGTLAASPGVSCSLGAYRGLLGSGGAADIDISVQATGTSGSTYDSGTTAGTTTAANELKIGAGGDDGANSTLAAGTSDGVYTLFTKANTSAFSQTLLEDRDSGASGSTARATMSSTLGAAGWSMSVVVYKLAAAGGTTQQMVNVRANIANKNVGPAVQRFAFHTPTPQYLNLAPVTNAEFGPVPQQVPNRNLGPQVLRYLYRQPFVLQPDLAPVTDTNFGTGAVRIPNRQVGPQVLRLLYRQPNLSQSDLAPITNTEFGPVPQQSPNKNVGPIVLRVNYHQPQIFTVTAPGGQDVTLALTGVSATASVGTLIPDTNIVTLTGVSSTASVGTLAPSTTVAITGVSSTASVGSLGPSTTLILSGTSSTTSVGTMAPSTTVALLSVTATGAVGNVVASGGDVTPTNAAQIIFLLPSGRLAKRITDKIYEELD